MIFESSSAPFSEATSEDTGGCSLLPKFCGILTPDLAANDTALLSGATSKLGVALATEFARHGHPLLLVDRDETALAALSAELEREHGISASYVAVDTRKPGAAQEIFTATIRQGLTIDILINHTATGFQAPPSSLCLELSFLVARRHIEAVMQLTRVVLPPMLRRRRGRILNLSCPPECDCHAPRPLSRASAACLRFFSKSLTTELRGSGVALTCLGADHFRTDPCAGERRGDTNSNDATTPGALTPKLVALAAYRSLMSGPNAPQLGPTLAEEEQQPR